MGSAPASGAANRALAVGNDARDLTPPGLLRRERSARGRAEQQPGRLRFHLFE